MDLDLEDEAAGLVGDLVQAARVPARQRQFAIKPTVERLTTLAYEHGLRPDLVRTLVVDVLAAPGIHLDQASLGSLVRHLYPVGDNTATDEPTGTVKDDVVLAIVGCLGQGELKPTMAVQALLLRWLVMVYHVLSPVAMTALSRSYAVLFNLLDTAGIRPQLCHVLVLITRRKHVRPFRIHSILDLAMQVGHDAHLVGLLRVFKNYYPEVIVGDATRGCASPFKHPDAQWRAHLDALRHAQWQSRLDAGGGADALFGSTVHNGFRVKQTVGRRAKGAALPTVHTNDAQEESVTLEEIDSAALLVQHLETIELPNQLVAVLADPLLQKLLLLRPSDESFARVENWMAACVSSAAHGSGRDELMDLVEVVHDYITSTRTFPPVFDPFFAEILARWDGKTEKQHIFEALAYAPAKVFHDKYNSTYAVLEAKLLDNTAESQLDLLSFYTLVVRVWINELSSYSTDQGVETCAAILALARHVSNLVLALVQNSLDTGSTTSGGVSTRAALAVVDFYEELATGLTLRHDNILACVQDLIPPAAAVYVLHFHPSAAVASRLYAVLASYKRAMEEAMSRRPSRNSAGATTTLADVNSALGSPLTDAERARISQFNGYLMDVCNCIWRSRAFSLKDTNALGCHVDGALTGKLAQYLTGLAGSELVLVSAFNVTHAPTLCRLAIAYLRTLEDAAGDTLAKRHAGPITQATLTQLAAAGGISVTWQAFRSGLLVYLEDRGFGGIAALMYNTMKNLMNARAA